MALVDRLRLPDEHTLEEGYIVLMESHVRYLREHEMTEVVEISGQQAEKFTGDFNGLLTANGIERKYHYLITRVNGMNCSNDYDGKATSFLIPNSSTISAFLAIYTSHES